MNKIRLAVICLEGLDNFMQWTEPLKKHFEVKVFIIRNDGDLIRAIGFADVIWCEWANEAAMAVTEMLSKRGSDKSKKKLIVRLHSYEALSPHPNNIKWDFVDHIVYVAEHIPEIVDVYFKDLHINARTLHTVIPNGVDISGIELNKQTSGYKICAVGGISHKKNPAMILQIFKKLLEKDDRYRLHIAGAYQEARYEIYFNHMIDAMGLMGKIVIHGHVKDMDTFYKDKDFILNTSVHEGHNVSIIEAMARGITPVVHNYYGADRQYAKDELFNTVDEAVDRIIAGEMTKAFIRKVVELKDWTLESQVNSFKDVINEVYLI